jgi:hypothetical protein
MSVLKLPRITTAERTGLTPAASEMLFDTTLNRVFIGDGATIGGVEIGSDISLDDYTLLSTTSSISGSLEASKQNNITLVAGSNVSITESPTDTWTISASVSGGSGDLSNYTLLTTTASISGSLQSQIDSITVPTSATFLSDYDNRYVNESDLVVTLSDYTLLSTTSSISGSLEASKQNNITLIAGSNVTITESPTDTWTISASGSGDLSDYTLLTTTASISGDLQSQISAITVPTSATFLSDYDARYVNESDLVVTLSDYTLLSTTASISGSLEASKQNNITLIAGSNVTITESPTDTWTISASVSGGSGDLSNYTLLSTTASISGNLQTQINTKQSLTTVIAMAIALG